jgi:hypothetical protein
MWVRTFAVLALGVGVFGSKTPQGRIVSLLFENDADWEVRFHAQPIAVMSDAESSIMQIVQAHFSSTSLPRRTKRKRCVGNIASRCSTLKNWTSA